MRILIFNKISHELYHLIKNALKDYTQCKIIPVKDYPEFQKEFYLSFSGEIIIVFFVTSEKDIDFLESLNKDFMDVKLIIDHPEHLNFAKKRILNLNPRIITDIQLQRDLIPGAVRGLVKEKLNKKI